MSDASWPWRLRHSFGDFYVLLDSHDRYVSDACVEGHADEWRDIVDGLRKRERKSHKRCALGFANGSALFHSPRNTMGRDARLPIARCDELADIIEAELAKPIAEEGYGDE